jgi:hypothetical protein
MNILEFIVDVLVLGPWHVVGIATGLACAWVAYTYLPETVDRASIAALTFFAGWILVLAFGSLFSKAK